jgi:uncharacterized membrane protein YqhA
MRSGTAGKSAEPGNIVRTDIALSAKMHRLTGRLSAPQVNRRELDVNRGLKFFLWLRALMLLASLGALCGSLLMYWEGAKFLAEAAGFVHPEMSVGLHMPTALVLEAMDSFLFAVVLTIFAYGIATGFVFHLSVEQKSTLPDWMMVNGINELKHTLAEVVLIILIVTFTKQVVAAEPPLNWSYLILPIAILLLAGALWLLRTHKGH